MKIDKKSWENVRLSDVISKKEENDKINAKNLFDRFLKVECLDPETLHLRRWVSQETEELPPTFYKIFRKGQILYPTRRPYLRKAALASFDGICGEKTLTLEMNEDRVDLHFLPFLFHSDSFYRYATSSMIGSVNPHVRWRDIANFQFRLPSKSTQNTLAKLLWDADKTLCAHVKLLESLKSTLHVKIDSMIPVSSEDFWMLGEIVTARKGITYKASDYGDSETGLPLLNLKSIERGGGFNKEGIKYYSGECQSKHFVHNGDLIVACTDLTRKGLVVGYPLDPCVYQDKKMLFTMDLVAITIADDALLRDYLYYVLKTTWAHWFMFAWSPGTTVLHLDSKGMGKLRVPKITIDEQKEIVAKLKAIETSIERCESKIAETKKLQMRIISEIF